MDKIYDEYYYKIYYWAIKKTRNKEDAEDLTNNIFVSIFEYLGKNIGIDKLDNLPDEKIKQYEQKAKDRIIYNYSWDKIVTDYETIFMKD